MQKNLGLIFVAVGCVMTLTGAGLAATCSQTQFGYCAPTPFSGVGVAAAAMGVILFFVGIIVVVRELGILRAPSPGPPGAPTVMCPVCGKPLAWIPTANRWFCSKCDAYR